MSSAYDFAVQMNAMNRRAEAKSMFQKCVIELLKSYVTETEARIAELDRISEYAKGESERWATMAAVIKVACASCFCFLCYLFIFLFACFRDYFLFRTSITTCTFYLSFPCLTFRRCKYRVKYWAPGFSLDGSGCD